MATELIERPLTPIEIKQRQVDHLRLLTEIDNYQSEIDEHRRCAKDAANEVARIQSRERELRRELRSGTCWEAVHVEPRQKSLEFADTLLERPTVPGVDGMSDEPDPETDPPGPPEHDEPALTDQDDAFGQRYPMARDHLSLRMNLEVVFQGPAPSTEQLAIYPVGSPEFDTIAHWCRMQLAEMNKRSHPELDVYLPKPPQPMPKVLKALMKPKRGARPLTQPKQRKPRSEPSFHGSGGVD
jgi:hypothetical protein